GRKGNPHALCLHGHNIVIDDSLFDQPVDIRPVRWNQRSEFVIHLELYRHLEFSHNLQLLKVNKTSALWFRQCPLLSYDPISPEVACGKLTISSPGCGLPTPRGRESLP